MGNTTSGPEQNTPEIQRIRNVLAQDTESFSGGNYTSEAQYNDASANKPYYHEYIQAKTAYLALKNNNQRGGTSSCAFKVGDIVKRKSRADEHDTCELHGKIVSVVESHEFPAGSGKKIPTMYVINCPELFKGTPNEGLKLVLPCCDLELIFDSIHNTSA
jgi:hypothetical protein